jgi:site-specific DNA-methyltransferase (adenine-specific)
MSRLPRWAAELLAGVAAPKRLAVHFSSKKQDYGTPRAFFERLHAVFGFTVDVCAHADNHKVPRYWAEQDDALSFCWADERGWMNPPYGRQLAKWMKHAAEQTSSLVVALVPARTDTQWFHRHVLPWAELVILIEGRLRFEGGPTNDAAPFPTMLVVYRPGRTYRPGAMPRFATMEARS